MFAMVLDDIKITSTPTVNMNRYIDLKVSNGAALKLDIGCDAANTGVKVSSGSWDTTLTIGATWSGFNTYKAQAENVRIYGNVRLLDCRNNYNYSAYIYTIDISHNDGLKTLICFNNMIEKITIGQNSMLDLLNCYDNTFTTGGFDKLMCQLPQTSTDARFKPLKDTNDNNYNTFMLTNSQNAIDKGWKVYYDTGYPIPSTYGNYNCNSGIEDAAVSSLNIYPNPVKDVLHIDTQEEVIYVGIYNMLGVEVLSAKGAKDINLETLPSGAYGVKVTTASGTRAMTIMKQ
jgi:hypothetical protein